MVKVSHLAAAASGAGAALVALTPGTLLANNNSLQPPYNDLYSNYQFPNGFQSSPDEYLQNLAAGLSLLEDSNRSICSLPDLDDKPNLSEAQKSYRDEDAARKAAEKQARQDSQQAWMRSQSQAPDPPQVMYCTV